MDEELRPSDGARFATHSRVTFAPSSASALFWQTPP
jgi:hypothetical protein